MKRLLIFLIGIISLGILSCSNKPQTSNMVESNDINDTINNEEIVEETIEELPVNPYQKYKFPPVDSLKFEDNSRLLESIEDNNRDSVFKVITMELQRFIKLKAIEKLGTITIINSQNNGKSE